MKKSASKRNSKKSKDSKGNKSTISKKSSLSKSSSKSKSKSKDKDSKKKSSKKNIEIVTDMNKITNPQLNQPRTTLDLNTIGENLNQNTRNFQNINNFPNFMGSGGLSNGFISPLSGNNINFGTQTIKSYDNLKSPNINMIKNVEDVKCEGCLEQKAICYCTECKKSFCPQCENQIHTIPAMRNHIRRPIDELDHLKKLCLHHNQCLIFFWINPVSKSNIESLFPFAFFKLQSMLLKYLLISLSASFASAIIFSKIFSIIFIFIFNFSYRKVNFSPINFVIFIHFFSKASFIEIII